MILCLAHMGMVYKASRAAVDRFEYTAKLAPENAFRRIVVPFHIAYRQEGLVNMYRAIIGFRKAYQPACSRIAYDPNVCLSAASARDDDGYR
jgi:hypothetical protein